TMSNTIMPTLDLSDCDNESTLTYRGEFTSTPSATPFATQATMSNTTATPLRLEDSTPSPAPLEPTMPNITATPFQGFSDIDPTPSLEVTPTAIPSQPNAAYTLETYTAFGLRDYQGNPENLALGESSTGNLNAETPVYMYRLEATKGQL